MPKFTYNNNSNNNHVQSKQAASLPLPSEEIYNGYGKKSNCSDAWGREKYCNQTAVDNMKGVLSRGKINDNQELAKKNLRNYYYACTVNTEGSPSYYDPCKFLYFWIGHEIKEKLQKSLNFSKAMRDIYIELGNFPWDPKDSMKKRTCTNIYPNITTHIFESAKNSFDYNYNIKALQSKSECKEYLRSAQYGQLLEAAQKIYPWLCTHCDSDKIEYCRKMKEEYMSNGINCNSGTLPVFTCPTMPEDEDEERTSCSGGEGSCPSKPAKAPTSTIQLTKENLDMLESNMKYYSRFKGGFGFCHYCKFPTREIANKIKAHFTEEKYANFLARVLCYASTKKQDEEFDDTHCKFFNFWLVYLLHKKLKHPTTTTSFSTVIEAINNLLENIPEGHKCPLPYPTLNKDVLSEATDFTTFNHRRIVYEYFIDHAKITADLSRATLTPDSGSPTSPSKPKCDKAYHDHLKAINTACTAVTSYCNDSTTNIDPYCNEYNSKYKTFCEDKDKLEKLTCTLQEGVSKEVEGGGGDPLLPSSVSSLTEDGDTAATCNEELTREAVSSTGAAAASSILGTVIGLPTIVTFFLYKVIVTIEIT
ncbi:KIR protein [Plasmodium coatneyi]|uniref:KIR protein n=1 Tax=Plasmodium coatneyi TaxID=208452 RepID=A0A1B1E7L7_9APIC|nr:KIR protein [Plasmodium coatneyi]ANQ10957.1 KIR protein [Plasmodium coatneyi]